MFVREYHTINFEALLNNRMPIIYHIICLKTLLYLNIIIYLNINIVIYLYTYSSIFCLR